jgi:hypothetical protein
MIARWWGGGRITAVSRALARPSLDLVEVDVEGTRGLVRREDVGALAAASDRHPARLLPGFDPFTNELPRRVDAVLAGDDHDRVHRTAGWVSPVLVVDGRIAGTWELTRGKRGAIEVVPFGRLPSGARAELAREADRIGAFVDQPVSLEIRTAPSPAGARRERREPSSGRPESTVRPDLRARRRAAPRCG